MLLLLELKRRQICWNSALREYQNGTFIQDSPKWKTDSRGRIQPPPHVSGPPSAGTVPLDGKRLAVRPADLALHAFRFSANAHVLGRGAALERPTASGCHSGPSSAVATERAVHVVEAIEEPEPRLNRRYRVIRTLSRRSVAASSCVYRTISNNGIRDWPDVLAGDAVLATAVPDRLLHNCHLHGINSRSCRLREPERTMRERR